MKVHSQFICQQCGYQSSSYLGKCPQCGEWNSLVETSVSTGSQLTVDSEQLTQNLIKLSEVKSQKLARFSSGFEEFDRVLGGGIVYGSIILIAGDPGIGKSTLLLQSAMQIASSQLIVHSSQKETKETMNREPKPDNQHAVLYVTGEESAQQVKLRADRLLGNWVIGSLGKEKPKNPKTQKPKDLLNNLYILPDTSVEAAVAVTQKIKPTLVIVDSIQTLTSGKLTGSAGSIGQVRECAQILQRVAKGGRTTMFLVGHVTKEGGIAGPKVLEHLVDAVLSLEGDLVHNFRLLRSIKNRFGSTFEVGVFEMRDLGLAEVSNPSQVFLAQRIASRSGSVVTSTIAGGRPILAEIQALTTNTMFGVPTRRVTGLDFSRVQIVIAALAKLAKLPLSTLDIYVNVAGGLKISEPAADLAAALAIVSAAIDKPVRERICAFGEVGLLGELRQVTNLTNRANEAKRLGFDDFVTPEKFKTLEEAIDYAIHGS